MPKFFVDQRASGDRGREKAKVKYAWSCISTSYFFMM